MFSEKLRQLRLSKKMTQSDMAKAINISRVAYTNYELGNREPDFETVKQIAIIFETSIDYLLSNSPDNKADSALNSDRIDNTYVSQLPHQLYRILRYASQLSPKSCDDLEKYIELLVLRDNSEKSGGKL